VTWWPVVAKGNLKRVKEELRREEHDEHGPAGIEHLVAPPMGVTVADARAIATPLPRSYEALVRDEVRLRVGRIVYASFSADDTIMGFAFPRDQRDALVASEPDKFLMPSRPSDLRFQWVCVRLDAINVDELRELLIDAWRMCVPKKVRDAYDRASA
jgi:hypothetical protein